ncbi:hypothetical protein B9Z55_025237 [Caenorhabditis nigoni]|uniref:CUB domain-containing protein n=1 Tax=Caenorhabditis nigoni TaxID=1611254 RepID=A0A2G5SY63_9PELO|nr:hypothetical protein B9Z55_025237 [Caenorhabditis nigoni]
MIRLSFLLLISLVLVYGTYVPEPFHTVTVPFKTENGGSTNESVFLEFHCHTVIYDKHMAIKMELEASEEVAIAADKCGRRIFQTSRDTKNFTILFDRDWVSAMLTGIAKTCDVASEYKVDLVFNCDGACSGNLSFSLAEIRTAKLDPSKSYNPNGVLEFNTIGGETPSIASAEIGVLVEAAFLNSRTRLNFEVNYTTDYTLAFEKCGLEYLQLEGHKGHKTHELGWEETKLIRLMATTQCEKDSKDMVNYAMRSWHPGNGTLSFHWKRVHQEMKQHPGNDVTEMVLAIGVPKHHKVKKEDRPTQLAHLVSCAIIPVIVVIRYRQFL